MTYSKGEQEPLSYEASTKQSYKNINSMLHIHAIIHDCQLFLQYTCRLAGAISRRVGEFTPMDLRAIISVYRDVCTRHVNLSPTLKDLEAKISPLISPTSPLSSLA